MIKERILIVEDDEYLPLAWQGAIRQQGDRATEVVIARSYSEAIEKASRGDIAYCILDLGIPEHSGGDPVEIENEAVCRLGFAALRHICAKNRFVQIVIASRFADESPVAIVKSQLELEHLPIKDVFNKNVDLDYLDRICEDIRGLDDVQVALDAVGVRVFHPAERRIVRDVRRLAGRGYCDWAHAPMLVIRGQAGSGKSMWGEVLYDFIQLLRPSDNRVPRFSEDIGQVGGASAGDSAKIWLFGARNFQGVDDCAGVFERATAYVRAGRQYVHQMPAAGGGRGAANPRLANGPDQVDPAASGVASLHELGNIPDECQTLLLRVLDRNPRVGGRVTPAGGGAETIQVGCAVAFTTNADIENRIARSDRAQRGQVREDLFQRLRSGATWLFVPNVLDLGKEVFFAHLDAALRYECQRDVEIATSAHALLEEAFDSRHASINMRFIDAVAKNYANDPQGGRLRDGHVLCELAAFGEAVRRSQTDVGYRVDNGGQGKMTADLVRTIEHLRTLPKVKSGTALAFIWKCLYEELEAALRKEARRVCVQKDDIRRKNDQLAKPHGATNLDNYLAKAGRELSQLVSSSGIEITSERHAILVQVREVGESH